MAPNAEILESSQPNPEFEQACCPNPLDLTSIIANSQSSPPLPSKVSIESLQTVTNVLKAKARETLRGPPPNLTKRDIEIPIHDGRSILAYIYAPSPDTITDTLPILIFFHKDSFCIDSRHDKLESNRTIAIEAGIIIVSLEYSLAPEYPFPQAIHDRIDASIANAVVYLNRDLDSPIKVTGQLLSIASLLPISMVPERYKDNYMSHEQNHNIAPNPTSPLFACAVHPSEHTKIPPTYLQACGLDTLRDETFIYQQILQQKNNIDTRIDLYPRLPHHFWEFFPQLRKHVKKRTDNTVKEIQWLLKNSQT
ncbi:Alpha/Beta hydrolase protein [Aspergillus parasiticus]|uniref:Alpha/Beta hydrolase protein n=1 Tax=Aspergillus parasiticus TaxID=5067 RepID=A0A5N6D7G5_ASPPA|nr:Alpha/Beta hydrolase protein [Aspergillus parasiticus]